MSTPTTPVRSVFSLWAWLVLAPYLLTGLGGFDGARTPQEWAVGISTTIEVQLALGGAFLLLALVDRRLATRPPLRWTFVALAVVGLAVGRPTLVQTLQGVFGFQLVPTPFPLRVLMNLLVIGTAVLLVHALIDSVARNLEVRRRLLAVLTGLRAQAERIEEEQERVATNFRREIAGPVVDALGRLIPRDLPPEQLAEELEWVAELVVRPISHRVRAAELDEALGDIDPTLPPPTPGRSLLQPSRIIAAPAWVVSVVIMVVLLPPEFNANGVGLGLLLLIAGGAASFLGGIVIQRMPLPRRTSTAIVLLALCYLVVGALTSWILLGPTIGSPLAGYYLAVATVGFATVATILSVILSSVRELAAHQHLVATAVTHAERRAYRARQTLIASADRMGRILHTTVQGDIIGTALQLKAGTAEAEALDRLLERVERALRLEGMNETDGEASALAIRQAIRAGLTTWSRSLDLRTEVSDAALDWLARHPSGAALANDAITEGLTNAVRHGSTVRARVSIALAPAADGGVEVRVANPGRLGPRTSNGLGLSDLDARARRVELSQEGDEVVLQVLV